MRLVEILTALAAIGSIATFLGVRLAIRKTIRSLGRKPEAPKPTKAIERREP